VDSRIKLQPNLFECLARPSY